MAAKIVQDARSAKFIGSCRAAARPKGGACAGNPRYNKSDTAYILNLFNFRTDTRTTPPCGGDPEAAIIALERRALERWNQGDPDGFLELTSGDVVYFDPALGRKIIGKKALGEYYGTVRGKVRIDTYRMIDPVVRLSPGAAVLAYDYEALRDGQVFRMHCTEVYTAATSGGWEIVHTHWSFARQDD